ncbi:hypothetical protein [Sporosarcina sp. G11-34]|uniref:hypothetical protein n=1 Tax=Sporosarcina sp. G11-34 TaxID=2849605 RepID=UPI0022A97EF0|nr:hypothetical protein [Sporosarcina sp. G11-34]
MSAIKKKVKSNTIKPIAILKVTLNKIVAASIILFEVSTSNPVTPTATATSLTMRRK